MADIKCQNYIHKYKCLEYVLDHNACMECDRRVINPVIEELEKIKEEIKQKQPIGYYNGRRDEGYDESIEIIDKHILEPKGENNE